MRSNRITSSRSIRLVMACFLAAASSQLSACNPKKVVDTANSYAWWQPPLTYDQMVFFGMSGCAPGVPWCACFAKHVWEKSFVFYLEDLDARAISFAEYGFWHGTLRQTNPKPGDAVIFDNVNGSWASHVAIVTEVFGAWDFQYVGGNQDGGRVTSELYDPDRYPPATTWFASPRWD